MLQILLRFSAVALWLFASRADFKKPEALQNFGFLPGMIKQWMERFGAQRDDQWDDCAQRDLEHLVNYTDHWIDIFPTWR
jgi:hypothetical protein